MATEPDRPASTAPDLAVQGPPLIVWTLRRTGGTALAALLFAHTGRRNWNDEAFNTDRSLGHVSRGAAAGRERGWIEAEVAAAMAEQRNLKHCIETVPWPVTAALLRVTAARNFRHMVLLRRNETDRLLSLILAIQTGAWSPHDGRTLHAELAAGRRVLHPADLDALRVQVHADATRIGQLMRMLLVNRVPHQVVVTEDVFAGEFTDRVAAYHALARALGLPEAGTPPESALRAGLIRGAQKSSDIHGFLPNLDEVKAMITALTE